MGHEKVAVIIIYGSGLFMEVTINGAKVLSGLTKVAFIERWPSYRVATIDRFH